MPSSRSRDTGVGVFFFDNRCTDGCESILSSCGAHSLSKNLHKEINNDHHRSMFVVIRHSGRGNDVCNESKFSIWSTFLLHPQFYKQATEENRFSAYISGFHTNLINGGHLMLFQSLPSRSPPRHFSLSKFKGRGISPTK